MNSVLLSMLLYLIRHGETQSNAERRIQGQLDVPLSDLGHRQGQAVVETLATVPLDAVYSSPLRRALETAQAIAERHSLRVHADPRLMELNAGTLQGKLLSELKGDSAAQLARWLPGGDEDFSIPGGESRRQLTDRGCEAIRAMVRAGHREAAVVTHGGLLSATMRALLDLPHPVPPFSLQNGSITKLAVDEHGRFSLVSLNDVKHLRDVGSPRGGVL
jgi:2,3-bisphosphoglycerate-dependent phosphoglycerate mutase